MNELSPFFLENKGDVLSAVAVAVTMTYFDCKENVYDLTLQQYNQLGNFTSKSSKKIFNIVLII